MINGGILIALGCIFLAYNLYDFDVETYWPVFFLIPTVLCLGAFISNRRNAGTLVPVGVFVIMGSMFQYCEFYGWHNMEWMWPGFLLGPGIGLFLFYLVNRERGLLIPASILTGLSVIFFLANSPYGDYWPVLLIIGGALLMARRKKSEPEKNL
jgi:hypothetical protein